MTVWLSQCLCPQRHAILGGAGEADDAQAAREAVEQPLREAIARMVMLGEINPWCGICHARTDTWRYETRRTEYATMAEAAEPLRRTEDKNIATGLIIGELAGTQKPPQGET